MPILDYYNKTVTSAANATIGNEDLVFATQLANKAITLFGISQGLQMQEEDEWTRTKTQYALEDGSVITDHASMGRVTVNQTFFISGYILGSRALTNIGLVALKSLLAEARKIVKLYRLVSKYVIYENMLLTSVKTLAEKDEDTLICDLRFEEVPYYNVTNTSQPNTNDNAFNLFSLSDNIKSGSYKII